MKEDKAPVIEDLKNELDEFIHAYVNGKGKKREQLYSGRLFNEQKKIFFETNFAPPGKSPEETILKFHNPITHTAKVVHTSSKTHVMGKSNAPLPEGYISLSSTKVREKRDYAGAATFATISKVFESKINDHNRFKDLLDMEDSNLKDFIGFDNDQWERLVEVNRMSRTFFANPRPDSLAKQILFNVGGDEYLNFTITPSPIFLYEFNMRIKERWANEEKFKGMAGKKIGGSNPLNASRLISKTCPERGQLNILAAHPFLLAEDRTIISWFTKRYNFFKAIYYNPRFHDELFTHFDKLLTLNENDKWIPNAKVQHGLDNCLRYIFEQITMRPAIVLQSQSPGWTDNKLVKLFDWQKKWLDPDNPKHEPRLDDRDLVAKDALSCLDRLYKDFRKKAPISLLQRKYFYRFTEIIKESL